MAAFHCGGVTRIQQTLTNEGVLMSTSARKQFEKVDSQLFSLGPSSNVVVWCLALLSQQEGSGLFYCSIIKIKNKHSHYPFPLSRMFFLYILEITSCSPSLCTMVVGTLQCSASVNFPPRPVCCNPCSVVMVSGGSAGEARVGRCRATVTMIYTHVGHFLRYLYCT